MAFHANLWILAGTGAPVIGLALTVSARTLRDVGNAVNALVTLIISTLNWGAQTLMLYGALRSLTIGHDAISPWIPVWVEPGGFLLVLYTNTFMTQAAFLKLRLAERSRASGRGQANTRQAGTAP